MEGMIGEIRLFGGNFAPDAALGDTTLGDVVLFRDAEASQGDTTLGDIVCVAELDPVEPAIVEADYFG